MPHPTPLPDPLDSRPFGRRDARERGISDSRLRRADLEAPFQGARSLLSLPQDLEWLCAAYQARAQPGFVFSHLTAARLYGAPLPLDLQRELPLHVSVTPPARSHQAHGVVGHQVRLTSIDRTEIIYIDPRTGHPFQLPVVRPAVMLAQVASLLRVDDVVAVADHLLQGKSPLCAADELATLVFSYRNRPGSRHLARAYPDFRLGSKSRAETLLRLQLVRAGIPEPLINDPVFDRNGLEVGTPDGCWPEFRVLYEYEGDHHRSSKGRFRQDITRIESYLDNGWAAVRIHGGDVFGDPNPMLARVARRLAAAGWRNPRHDLRKVAAAIR